MRSTQKIGDTMNLSIGRAAIRAMKPLIGRIQWMKRNVNMEVIFYSIDTKNDVVMPILRAGQEIIFCNQK